MRDNMYENPINPFDPEWFKDAFDKFISIDDQRINQNSIINEGFILPDADGSRSSIFRNDAVLNNSFNEKNVRESLKDIYLNSSHKLIASNHDNVNYFQWVGNIKDFNIIENTNIVELRIPWNIFILAKERYVYKTSKFFSNWIKDIDIANNWDIFKFYLMVFVDKRIYSEYEIKITEQDVIIRFNYLQQWIDRNVPIYIYKFDTNFQYKALISLELCRNQWNWMMPITYIKDKRILNHSKIIVAFNKILDNSIRTDGNTHVDILGDNLEFLDIENGFIDLKKISKFNRVLIESELREYLTMTIVVPKFLQEYPILLPVDPIFHSRVIDLRSIITFRSEEIQKVKSSLTEDENNTRQVYMDYNGKLENTYNGWTQLIRPVVLTDAYENPDLEPYEDIFDDMKNLRDLTVKLADLDEEFRFYIRDELVIRDKFMEYVDNIKSTARDLYNTYNEFLERRVIDKDINYDDIYNTKFIPAIEEISKNIDNSYLFKPTSNVDETFWSITSPLIWIPRSIADKYYVVIHIKDMKIRHLWNKVSDHLGKNRFQRPIDESDFWTFEYDSNKKVWRPYPLQINRKFPDVYLMNDPVEEVPSLNRIFKAFFFYSDTINVRNEESDIVVSSQSWDEDIIKYYHEPEARYRDIFMEKFYWMAIKSIYNGKLVTRSRWEALEYIINNPAYERFNQLFLRTMDPYFKLGLATYLKSSNFEFPFDDAIDKLTESMNLDWNGFRKITNFEIYLNKNWVPSYFDYVTRIMKDWKYENRLLRRPDKTFDIRRLQNTLITVSKSTIYILEKNIEKLEWIISNLYEVDYHLDVILLNKLLDEIKKNHNILKVKVLDFITNLDMDIYSINDLLFIISQIDGYNSSIEYLLQLFSEAEYNVELRNIYESKREILEQVNGILISAEISMYKTLGILELFDIDIFMNIVNDLDTYLYSNKINPNDDSLLYQINQFNDPWTIEVKEKRNLLFQSTAILYGSYDPNKIYSNEEIEKFVQLVDAVKENMKSFREILMDFWSTRKLKVDQFVIDRLDNAETIVDRFIINIGSYKDSFSELKIIIDSAKELISLFYDNKINKPEIEFKNIILEELENITKAVSNNITGNNNKIKAEEALKITRETILSWLKFIDNEEIIFIALLDIVENPSAITEVMTSNQLVLEDIINFINYSANLYIPDIKLPTYSDIYEVDKIVIDNKGFWHSVGDLVFIPSIGVYRITSVSDEVLRAEIIEEIGYRKSTFRDPLNQSAPYNTLTNGAGMGLTIKVLSSNHNRIINDEVILKFINRLKDVLRIIQKFIMLYNSKNNIDYNIYINIIKDINNNWNEVFLRYENYLTNDISSKINNIMSVMMTLINPSNTFMEKRNNINVGNIYIKFEEIINESYKYMDSINELDESFHYYDSQVKSIFNELRDFIGFDGTNWENISELKRLFGESIKAVDIYRNNVLSGKPSGDNLNYLKGLILDFKNSIIIINNNIDDLHTYADPIQNIINNITTLINNLPENLYKDEYYRIVNIVPANNGSRYKIGDIVEIISNVPPVDQEHIFLQITAVDNGIITKIQPLMDYALPYSIFGIYNTITCTGNGAGLTVDIFSSRIEIGDSTLVIDETSYTKEANKFNDLDLFMFKFENIYDLPIQYEVFIAGKPIQNFYHRHELVDDPLHPKKIDVIYINANEIYNLKNSSIYVPGEQYFIYKIDEINIKDPGAGYCVGQEIFVDANIYILHLRVASLLYEPYKGIDKVTVASGKLTSKTLNSMTIDAMVVEDSLSNIDDEYHLSTYDKIPKEGIKKPLAFSYPQSEYEFTSNRYDNLPIDDRNKTFMYPDIDFSSDFPEGDPEKGWYLGSRIDNSQHPVIDPHKWNGIINLEPPTDSFIPDNRRVPPNQPIRGEYQLFDRVQFHKNTHPVINGDLEVLSYKDIPRHVEEWPEAMISKSVIVENDETNEGHRMRYIVRSCNIKGFLVYNIPERVDINWNHISVDWMNSDWYPDIPTLKEQYPDAPWRTAKTYAEILAAIADGKYKRYNNPSIINNTSYIHDVSVDDLSVFNWTTKTWEDLHDTDRWKLEIRDDPDNKNWGFTLTFLLDESYSYDMKFYWNKIPTTQSKNADLCRNAIMDIIATVIGEVNKPSMLLETNVNRNVTIRKLFPYKQKESFIIGPSSGSEMDFKLAPYMHFKNEIHLEDIAIYNKTMNRFEDIMDINRFEVRFKDPKTSNRGWELQTKIINSYVSSSGSGFYNGHVWGWNSQYGIHLFGEVRVDNIVDGHVVSFTPLHCPNPITDNILLEFQFFQNEEQTEAQQAVIVIEFKTEKLEVFGDGYIHNVINRLAPVPEEFKIIFRNNLDSDLEYDIIIDKSPQTYDYFHPNWIMSPIIHIPDRTVPSDRIYIESDKGRFPLINPSTKLPSIVARHSDTGTDVSFYNLYRRWEHLKVKVSPYPMRSVYTQRSIPSTGFIDLTGKLNKPLNKKYFEFWVNGRMLTDELTIITPTKIFLHGLKSLRNFEIIEINRDANEYFSDTFLEKKETENGRPYPIWNYETYLDLALLNRLEKDNYTTEEQTYLLSPVWPQVDKNNPYFKDYPVNVDEELDIMTRVMVPQDLPIEAVDGDESFLYQFMIVNLPTLEDVQIAGWNMEWWQFGFNPVTNEQIVDLFNEEWKDEIANNPYFKTHTVISEEDWHGTVARLYDEYGMQVTNLNDSSYTIADFDLIVINTKNRTSRIIHSMPNYDLT